MSQQKYRALDDTEDDTKEHTGLSMRSVAGLQLWWTFLALNPSPTTLFGGAGKYKVFGSAVDGYLPHLGVGTIFASARPRQKESGVANHRNGDAWLTSSLFCLSPPDPQGTCGALFSADHPKSGWVVV